MTSPKRSIHACHRQNWFLPAMVRTNNSTPLFANNRHMPDKIPENDAYDIANSVGTREDHVAGM